MGVVRRCQTVDVHVLLSSSFQKKEQDSRCNITSIFVGGLHAGDVSHCTVKL